MLCWVVKLTDPIDSQEHSVLKLWNVSTWLHRVKSQKTWVIKINAMATLNLGTEIKVSVEEK
jgi:hypothetical protein